MGKKSVWLQDFVWKQKKNSFVKKRKDKSFFNRNTCVQQEKISTVGVALGAVFIKKTRSNYPISLFGRTGILSRNSKIALIITPKLLTCCKKAFFLASSERYFSNKRNKKWARCTIDDRGWESVLVGVLRDISFACSVPSSWAIAQYYGDLEPVADKVWQISIVIVKTTIIGEKFRIETNKSKNRTISD